MDGNGAGARSFFCGLFCGPLAWTLDDGSVGFSTRRDDPSNCEFSSRPMKNVTLDRTTVLQLDADGTDSALDAAADCNALRNDVALDLCAFADQKIRGAQLAFDSAQDLRWTITFDLADDRHVGADARGRSRFCRGL